MMQDDKQYRVFISAAEPSADDHCANLAGALARAGRDNIELVGIGGPKMEQAGCDLLQKTGEKATMGFGPLAELGYYYKLLKRIKNYLRNEKIDLVVVCDSPAFNWHVAKCAKKIGIKTVFYVAPQLWAWARWRIRKMRRCCDKLCCLLPFEEDWFASRGVETVFVGNPMLAAIEMPWGRPKDYTSFDSKKARIAIIPGSRQAELKNLWKPMQQIALRLKAKYPGATFVTVAVDEKWKKTLEENQIPGFQCDYAVNAVCQTAHEADFAIVTSGSATLEVAAMACPMVVMYQANKIAWHLLGRWLVKTPHLSLVNVAAGREMVPEFMPYFNSIDPIVDTIERLLDNKNELAALSDELVDLTAPFARKDTGAEVAKVIIEMLD
ncbi:MAG: lipid-A-disaccharide synthase [Planctomycetota bacterium]|jgi:lipid-A-disaccharide synthase